MSLALKRLEARGKGILLLHDIHPKTVAALPGLLKELKDNGFRIVQVVPAASYQIAMANKPATRMLASAIPEQLNIADGVGAAARPSWPESAASLTPDDVMLPVPEDVYKRQHYQRPYERSRIRVDTPRRLQQIYSAAACARSPSWRG